MNITVTGRHVHVSKRLNEYAEKKIQKLENYFQQLLSADIILYAENRDNGAEVIVNGDGVQFHGREKAADLYSAIDLLFEKMEKQIVRYKEKHSSHKVVPTGELVPFDYKIEEGKKIQLRQVSNKPIDKIEAYLQMKNDSSDFILFKKGVFEVESTKDYSNKSYAVIFKSNEAFKLVKIPFDDIKEHHFEQDTFVEYDLKVIDDSFVNPDIEFKKNSKCSVMKLTINDALDEIMKTEREFLPFFNTEAQYFNIIYKTGKEYEVMVPAF